MGTGMLVTHVDYEAGAWLSNAVNNDPLHQRMAYIPADNKKDGTRTGKGMTLTQLFNGYKGDLFPGLQNVTSLTDDTLPATTLFNGTAGKLGKPILNISQNEQGVISFDFITLAPAASPKCLAPPDCRQRLSTRSPVAAFLTGNKPNRVSTFCLTAQKSSNTKPTSRQFIQQPRPFAFQANRWGCFLDTYLCCRSIITPAP